MKEDRMRFTRVRTPHDDEVGGFNFFIGNGAAASTKYCRQTDDRGSVSRSITGVDIVRPHHFAGKPLRSVVHLICRLRAAEHAKGRLAFVLNSSEASGDFLERLVPRCGDQFVVDTNERSSKSLPWHWPSVSSGLRSSPFSL